jgi:hypothetical protein
MSDTVVEVIVSGVCGAIGDVIISGGCAAVDVVETDFTVHNSLPDLQGGASGQFYHLTSGQWSTLTGLPSKTVDPREDVYFEKDVHVSGTLYQGTGYSKELTGIRTIADGQFYEKGDAQVSEFILKRETTDGGTYEMAFPNQLKKLNLPDTTVWSFKIKVIARSPAGDAAVWNGEGSIKRGPSAAFTEIVGATHLIRIADQIGTGGVSIVANTTYGYLQINVTGKAATTIRWMAYLTLMQIQ